MIQLARIQVKSALLVFCVLVHSISAFAQSANANNIYREFASSKEPILPSSRATQIIQQRLEESGVVVLAPGVFKLTSGLLISNNNSTLIGAGADRTTLIFEHQFGPEPGILVTASSVSVVGMTLKDALGTGLEARSLQDLLLKDIRINWDWNRSRLEGINGLEIKDSKNIRIQNVKVSNAWSTGIFLRQVVNVIINGCKILDNTVGVMVEDAAHIDILNSNFHFNSLGIFIKSVGKDAYTNHIRAVGNTFEDNNRLNEAPADDAAWFAPKGIGILVRGVEYVDILLNSFKRNGSAGIWIETDEWFNVPREIYIRDNSILGNGYVPDTLRLGTEVANLEIPEFADIVWDGYDHLSGTLAFTQASDVMFIGDNDQATFLDLNERWRLPIFTRTPKREWRGNLEKTKPFLPKVTVELALHHQAFLID